MIQNIIIIVILIGCAFYIGRRMYNNLRNSKTGGGCGCSCSGCDPDFVSTCNLQSTDSDPK
jgi:hypothetical protein